jgi:hypothetical protein
MHPLRRLMTYGQSYWMDNYNVPQKLDRSLR